MANSALCELKQDLEEYEELYKNAQRPKVQEHLLKEINRLRKEVASLEKKAARRPAGAPGDLASDSHGADKGENTPSYVENITNYGFDQTKQYMELYLSLDKLGEISDGDIEASFTNRSVTVKVHFPNKTSQLHIARLCEDIVPEGSYCKKKSKHVVVMLKKAELGKTWPSLTEREKKAKEKKEKPNFDANEDPSASLTKLLKTMYDDGDDEMKRTISKAWFESQTKQRSGGDPFSAL
ncbi:hypothetical protein BsWGS_23158 [Bradybaena similaris]